jgi:hypothetical protein
MKLPSMGVWCAVSRRRIFRPIFFQNTTNSECYTDIIHGYLGQLTEEETAEAWFQEDNATCRTAWATMRELSLLVGDAIISKGLWPPHTPDLSPSGFFCVGLH